jgi:hypothetical protein
MCRKRLKKDSRFISKVCHEESLGGAKLFGRSVGTGHFTGSKGGAELFGGQEGGFLLAGLCKSL